MADDYVALANTTLSTTASTVTFSSISGDYRDLVLVINGSSASSVQVRIRYNGDTGSNYNHVRMYGNGTTATSITSASDTVLRISTNFSNTAQGMLIHQVFDYATTNKHKSSLSRHDTASQLTEATAGRWASTSAITSMAVITNTGTFDSGTTFALYGIRA